MHSTIFRFQKKIFCAGRLDKDTTGLLIFSTNGSFINYITSPESNISKTYFVSLDYEICKTCQKIILDFAKIGVLLSEEKKSNKYFTLPFCINFIDNKTCTITLTEGKFHEVKRIFNFFGNNVIDLRRIEIGKVNIEKIFDNEKGNYKFLTKEQLNIL